MWFFITCKSNNLQNCLKIFDDINDQKGIFKKVELIKEEIFEIKEAKLKNNQSSKIFKEHQSQNEENSISWNEE